MLEEHQASTRPVHEKFNEVLKALGTNAYQLSKPLGLTRADKYYKIEKGQAKPSFETIAEIVRFYPQVNVNYYFKDHVPILEEEINLATEKPVSVQALYIVHHRKYLKAVVKPINAYLRVKGFILEEKTN